MESTGQILVVIGWLAAMCALVRLMTGRRRGADAVRKDERFWDW